MRVVVDQTKCQGHSLCEALAPSLFELSEETGLSRAIDGEVPEDFVPSARQAATSCPEHAIRVKLRG